MSEQEEQLYYGRIDETLRAMYDRIDDETLRAMYEIAFPYEVWLANNRPTSCYVVLPDGKLYRCGAFQPIKNQRRIRLVAKACPAPADLNLLTVTIHE